MEKYQVVIVGGGTAGLSVAAQLAKKMNPEGIAIIDPADEHYYQPIWTLVGAGILNKNASMRKQKSLIPKGVHHILDAADSFIPEEQLVLTKGGKKIQYDYLVAAPGLKLNWEAVKGLKDAIGKDGVVSNYDYRYVEKTWEALQTFKGGNAIFTHPNTPIKCGGAPQKIMYLADDVLKERGVRDNTNIMFYSADPAIFAVDKYRKTLETVIERKSIKTKYQHNLVEVRPDNKEAVFENMQTGETETVHYDMLHVTPPMAPPDFIKNSPLADAAGWVDVDQYTLQHKKFKNIFALGDASNLPTSKTGAAIRKQAPVVVKNLLSRRKNVPLTARYDGYTSCPLVTGKGKLVLAEFDYDKNPKETFPFNQAKERYSMYFLKKNLLPIFYWKGMMKGKM